MALASMQVAIARLVQVVSGVANSILKLNAQELDACERPAARPLPTGNEPEGGGTDVKHVLRMIDKGMRCRRSESIS